MKNRGNKKRCCALAEYMEAAAWLADPRDRVAACLEDASQELSAAVACIRAVAGESDELAGAARIVERAAREINEAMMVMRGTWEE